MIPPPSMRFLTMQYSAFSMRKNWKEYGRLSKEKENNVSGNTSAQGRHSDKSQRVQKDGEQKKVFLNRI